MKKIQISESQLQNLIMQEIKRTLNEEIEEGWLNNAWNSIKGGIKGAGRGYQQANLMGVDDANITKLPDMGRIDKWIMSATNVKDAAAIYQKLMSLASKYATDAKNLKAKMREIGAAHDVSLKQNRQGGKFAAGVTAQDNGQGSGYYANFRGNSSSHQRARNLQQQNLNFQPQGNNTGRGTANLEEAINAAVMQTLIEEGLWSNLKGAWQGMKQGAQMGRALGSDAKADYANGNEATRNWDPYDGRKDAKGSIMKFSEMAKNYDAIAAQLREKAKALATKWNIVRSNAGQAGPAQYGYKKQPQPQAQPNPVADNPTPVNEALVRKIVVESIKKIMKEGI